ncbi:phospholipid carrier-dependent glycosyltransferase [Salibacteraceae bacterium]|nr:phospholipid carrier-dependent glycosyltransferase [Salibacteraceae bacterium]
MKKPKMHRLSKSERLWAIALFVLSGFAYLFNIGLLPLRIDESIRTTIAIEMMNSGDYIKPTMWGRFYYSKPPLFNWIVIGFWQLFDEVSLFTYRLPSVLSFLGIAVVTWFVSRKHIGERAAVMAAFGFLLSSTVVIRDSMFGYIDPMLSMVTLMGFYTVFHFHQKKQYWPLFLLSYLLAAIGVMLKGAPTLLFQALTLSAWFLYKRDFRSLFRPAHFAGIGLFILIVGSYFYVYSMQNDVANYAAGLEKQVALRTPAHHSWYETLFYYIIFPFENFGMLLPTSLFTIVAMRKGMLKRWLKNDFLAFTLMVICVNIIPYWLSPGYRFRYLMMLYPLWFMLGAEAYYNIQDAEKMKQWINRAFLLIGLLLIPLFVYWYFFQLQETGIEETIWLIALSLAAATGLYLWFRNKTHRVYLSFMFIILFRIGYDVGFIPQWSSDEKNIEVYKRTQAGRILEAADGKPIRVFGKTPMSRSYAFYLGSGQQNIIKRSTEKDTNYVYLITDTRLPMIKNYEYDILYEYDLRFKTYVVYLVDFKGKSEG